MKGVQLAECDIAIGREQFGVLVDWLVELWEANEMMTSHLGQTPHEIIDELGNKLEVMRREMGRLNERLASHCACQCDDDGNINVNEMCLEHHMIVNDAMKAEREACAKICDAFDTINDDGYPARPEGSVQGAKIIAGVIRERRP